MSLRASGSRSSSCRATSINSMKVSVRLFAQLRERCGERVDVELAEGATVADALAALGRERELGELLERMPLAVAVNREYADSAHALAAGDELALIPPRSEEHTSELQSHVNL